MPLDHLRARHLDHLGVMRRCRGRKKLQERWVLLSKDDSAGAVFARSAGGDLGTWITPADPTLGQRRGDVWKLHKRSSDLAAPAAYRLQRDVQMDRRARSRARQRRAGDARSARARAAPDLLVQSIAVQRVAHNPALNRYVATIRNAGATAAGPFEVLVHARGACGQNEGRAAPGAACTAQESVRRAPPAAAPPRPTVTVDPERPGQRLQSSEQLDDGRLSARRSRPAESLASSR